jgi:hypothetical protein
VHSFLSIFDNNIRQVIDNHALLIHLERRYLGGQTKFGTLEPER